MLLLYDVNQYCNVENSTLLFKIHTRQLGADLLQHFGPEIGPSLGFTNRDCKDYGLSLSSYVTYWFL